MEVLDRFVDGFTTEKCFGFIFVVLRIKTLLKKGSTLSGANSFLLE